MNRTDSLPVLSIVTPCLNRAHMIERAIESVLHQDYPSVEHIVVDGGSTDGTLDVLRRYPHLIVKSEPDKNLWDGLNKGIRMATGEVIGHLNSDDYYEPNIFRAVMQPFLDDPSVEMVSGGAIVVSDSDRQPPEILFDFTSPEHQQANYFNALLGVPIPNARFIRKSLFDRIGLMDIRYPLIADRDFLVRAVMAGVKSVSLNRLVYRYVSHEGSLSINIQNNVLRRLREKIGMANDYFQRPDLPPDVMSHIRLWHNRETIEIVLRLLYCGRLREALQYARGGCARDVRWPLLLLANALPRALKLPFKSVPPFK